MTGGAPPLLRRSFQRLPVKLANTAGDGLSRLGIRPGALEAERLCRKAREKTGLDDFGDEAFREALSILLSAIDREANLHTFGRLLAREWIVRCLAARLQMQAQWKQRPEILEIPVARPLFVVGLPRSGTTLLFNLLAQDPAHRWLTNWEALNLGRSLVREPAHAQRGAVRANRLTRWLVPELQRKHALTPELPEECWRLLWNTFEAAVFFTWFDVPSYRTWLLSRDRASGYRYYRAQLQILQERRHAERWLLKAPEHAFNLDALLAAFPDACIVQTHRDPLKVLPSACSLAATLRGLYVPAVDCGRLGVEAVDYFSLGLGRCMAIRGKYSPDRFLDVHYEALVRDPLAAVAGVYRHFDLPLTEESLTRMRGYLAAHGQHEHGVHRYSLADFGMAEAAVSRRFKDYVDYFGIISEGAS